MKKTTIAKRRFKRFMSRYECYFLEGNYYCEVYNLFNGAMYKINNICFADADNITLMSINSKYLDVCPFLIDDKEVLDFGLLWEGLHDLSSKQGRKKAIEIAKQNLKKCY